MSSRPLAALALLALAACSAPRLDAPAARVPLATSSGADVSRSNEPAKQIFGRIGLPSPGPAAAYGSYAKGCLAGAVQLPETGPTWQAMRLSRNRNWGSPELIAFLKRYSAKVARIPGWEGVYIGDLSQPRGGPMLGGHASHQTGLDADIWLNPARTLTLSKDDRERISASNFQRSGGAYVNSDWTPGHMAMVKAAAEDPAVERIFIFAGAKVQMCKDARGNRAWLRKVRPWYGHNDHIHIRLACPKGMRGCTAQTPPPPGDGCDEAETWVNGILHPPKPDPNAPKPKPRRPLTLADLPAQCAAVVSAN
ncbi:penicillin-insensitive murein endopeptidase [Frigidibacter sp. ROC022]|uniref:penicillin-insensitive murein endopeptidase n=1 Tax=Frigidibacter sp. ROC022 TaxID=2971796 RepID=UPI00215A3D87|nr:penicillin-insensitive murein endopeptidase [Frigidibacter sp. ROC022]MCR8724714.1 penicillin-insensitive murein endopeptidase [Frigidibacter sp. ROC022]